MVVKRSRSGVLNRLRACTQRAFFALLAAFATSISAANEPPLTIIYYHNGESAANNFKLLKDEFDLYFSRTGSLRFQPVRHRVDLESAITAGTIRIAVLSSWHFRELQRRGVPLHPLLVGEWEGNCRQTHIFWMRADNVSDSSARPLLLASSRPKEEIARFLAGSTEFALPDFRILPVPKDVDALLSVTFGMADAALATRTASDAFFRANPAQSNRLTHHGKEMADLHPVVATLDPNLAAIDEVIRRLELMGDTPEGRQCLLLLGLDRFRRLDDDLRKELAP